MPDRSWYTIRAEADRDPEILIYDRIGEGGWFDEGVTARALVEQLRAIDAPRLSVRINSPGGSVFDGLAIYNALVAHPATVTTYIDGLAASIASVVALAGERVVMASNALYMIHNPSAMAEGDAAELRRIAGLLDTVRGSMLTTYSAHTALTDDELTAALDAETWYTAEQAVEAGFATELADQLALAATFDLSMYRNPPIPAPAAAAAVTPREDTMPTATLPAAATEPANTHVPPAPTASAAAPRWADVVIAAHFRNEDPARWAAMQERLASVQAALTPNVPGDGVIDIPADVSGVLPTPIVQEVHSWGRGQRPVSALFGLTGLPFREGPSFSWPYLVKRPKADFQATPGTAVYKTEIDIDGMPFTKTTIAAQLKAPFQLVWTSPQVLTEVGTLMKEGYNERFEQAVCDDFVTRILAGNTHEVDFADGEAFQDAVLDAFAEVNATTRAGANCIVASYDMAIGVRKLRATDGRPLYPRVGATNADGTVNIAGLPEIEGITPTVGWDLPAGTFIIGHTKGYKTFDDGSNFLSQTDLTNLADDKVVYGFGAFGPMDMEAFVKLVQDDGVPLSAD